MALQCAVTTAPWPGVVPCKTSRLSFSKLRGPRTQECQSLYLGIILIAEATTRHCVAVNQAISAITITLLMPQP